MPNIPLLVSLVVIPISSILLYIPWTNHKTLFYPSSSSKVAESLTTNLNLDSCSRLVAPEGFGWCSEPVVERSSATGYFVCDDQQAWWDPVRGRWEAAPSETKGGSLWAWDLKDGAALPRQLQLSNPPTGSLHPLSISIVPSSQTSGPSDANIVVVSNHPWPAESGVIDIFRHVPAEDSLVHYDRLWGKQISDQSPFRVQAVSESWGSLVSPIQEDAGPQIKLPSILFTAVTSPEAHAKKASRSGSYDLTNVPTISEYLRNLFFPSQAIPPTDIYLHLSNGYTSRSLFQTSSTHPTLPVLLRSYDGGGAKAGSNTSLHQIYVSSISPKMSLIEQWDQHWVRGIESGRELVFNRKTKQDVTVKWPELVTFWSKFFERPLSGLDVDSLGRIWTIGAIDQGRVEGLINAIRSGISSSKDVPSPGALVHQTTYIYRLGQAMAHPWEIRRLADARKRGIWLSKEFYSTLVYQLGLASQSPSGQLEEEEGFLPRAPTGIAIDEDRKRVIVTSSWDQGVAVCQWKEGWVEIEGAAE